MNWKIICPPNNWKEPITVTEKELDIVLEVVGRLNIPFNKDSSSNKLYIGGADKGLGLVTRLANTLNDEDLIRAALKSFPIILNEANLAGVSLRHKAYILATAVHESGAGLWMEEWASGADYEGRADLGNHQKGDGVKFKGRGYVQLTGRFNYQYWTDKLGVDLIKSPVQASQPNIAAKILVYGMIKGTFTGISLGTMTDFVNMRGIINGNDKAKEIAAIAEKLFKELSKG